MSPRNHTVPPRSQICQNTAGQESGGVGAGRLGVCREATVGNLTLNGRAGGSATRYTAQNIFLPCPVVSGVR